MHPFARLIRHRLATAGAAAALLSLTAPSGVLAQTEDAAQIVADHIRAQGYVCDEPVTATKDTADSAPDEVAWRVECANATYRVRLRADIAAEVQLLK